MRTYFGISSVVTVGMLSQASSSIVWGSPVEQPTAVIGSLPSCAVACLASAIDQSNCGLADLQCACSDTHLQTTASRCIKNSCTLSEELSTQNITKAACGFPVRNRAPSFNATIIALGVATTLITVVRLVFKKFYSQQKVLHPDDWITAVSLALCLSGVAVGIGGLTPAGLGKDIWTLNISKIAKFATYFYAMELIYISGVSLIKLSLTLFYLRVFPGNMIRLFLWGTILLNTLYGVVFGSIAIFQCSPVSYYWDQYSGDAQGHCININLFGWLHAAVGVALDILMLTLPLSQVVRLQLHWKKKLGVSAMFVLGTFVTVVSILRLHSLVYLATSDNPTWDQWTTALWSVIEVNVGIICTCLPSMRLLLLRMFPALFGTRISTCTTHETSAARIDHVVPMGKV